MRILKPEGLFYLNAPSAGSVHRYPVDCWRFYPDSGLALTNWGRRNDIPCSLVESFIHEGGSWQDFVAVILKDEKYLGRYTERIIDSRTNYQNGRCAEFDGIRNAIDLCQNEQKLLAVKAIVRIEH